MKAKLTLIASALLLMSNIAGAQEQKAPSAKEIGRDIGEQLGERVGEIIRNVMAHGTMGGGMMGRGMMGRGMMGHGMCMRVMFALMDTDGDGTISLEEFQTAHAKIFKAIDANKDGKVTLEEMQMFFHGGSPTSDQ